MMEILLQILDLDSSIETLDNSNRILFLKFFQNLSAKIDSLRLC